MYETRITFGGGDACVTQAREADLVAFLQFRQQFVTAVTDARRRTISEEPFRLLFGRTASPALICHVMSIVEQLGIQDVRAASCIYPFDPTPLSVYVAEKMGVGLFNCRMHGREDERTAYALDGQEEMFHFIYLSLEHIECTHEAFDYWLSRLSRYLAPGGVALVYVPETKSISVYENDIAPDLREYADAQGLFSLGEFDQLSVADILTGVSRSGFDRPRGLKRLGKRFSAASYHGLKSHVHSLFSPLGINLDGYDEWSRQTMLPESVCFMVQQ